MTPDGELSDEERKIIKLLPCPFCGGHAEMLLYPWQGRCEICHSRGPIGNTEYDACEEWNKRYKI
jgi:hypothetical protein